MSNQLGFKRQTNDPEKSSRPVTDLRVNKKCFGHIEGPTWDCKGEKTWRINIAIEIPGGWKWQSIVQRFETEQKARDFITRIFQDLNHKYTLHFIEE